MESGATRTIGLVAVAGGAAETQLDASAVLLPLLIDCLFGTTIVCPTSATHASYVHTISVELTCYSQIYLPCTSAAGRGNKR